MIGGRALVTGTSGSPLAPSSTAALVGAPLQAPDRLALSDEKEMPVVLRESHRELGKHFVLVLEGCPAGCGTPRRAVPSRGPRGPRTPTRQLGHCFLHPVFRGYH